MSKGRINTVPNPSAFHLAEQKRIIAKLEEILPFVNG